MRLVAPDFPGFGLSPLPDKVRSLSDYARDVAGVLDALGIDQTIVVGCSMGGTVAFHLIAELGARLRGILLAGSNPTGDTEETARALHELAAEVEASGASAVAADAYLPKLLGPTTQRDHPEFLDRLREIICENSPAGIATALRAMAGRQDFSALLPRIHYPVLCLTGHEDLFTPPEAIQALAEQIPGARTSFIPGAGHLANLEAPGSFNEELTSFVAECSPA